MTNVTITTATNDESYMNNDSNQHSSISNEPLSKPLKIKFVVLFLILFVVILSFFVFLDSNDAIELKAIKMIVILLTGISGLSIFLGNRTYKLSGRNYGTAALMINCFFSSLIFSLMQAVLTWNEGDSFKDALHGFLFLFIGYFIINTFPSIYFNRQSRTDTAA